MLQIEAESKCEIWIKGIEFPVYLIKQVFTNKNGSTGILFLVTDDASLTPTEIADTYHKRWKIEEYHKSLKSNLCLEKSPTQTVKTQSNHVFLCIYAFVKLEILKIKTKMNHFALKTKIYLRGLQKSMTTLKFCYAA